MANDLPMGATDTLREQVRAWLHDIDAPVPPLGNKSKHIRDPLHGSVVLSPHEVRLIDTLLLQRLRGIHQLGLAYLTFPSARHSRFEHALGVRFVAEQMLDRLADAQRGYSATHRATVLAAALLHDVGHGVFSHATEDIIGSTPIFAEQFDSTVGALHEQIGALLIQEEPLSHCLTDAGIDPRAVAALLTHDVATLVSLGVPTELWGIISGPLDADKLDYFARDSYFSGVASAVDPERILRMLTIGPNDELAITLAGASALDQMLFDRVRMYSDLYGHQKILAAEAMVRGIVETMQQRGSHGRHRQLYVRGRDGRSVSISLSRVTDFLRMSDEAFLATPTDSTTVADLQNRLLRRELLRPAYTLTFEAVRGMNEATYLQGLHRLRTPASLSQLRREIQIHHPDIQPADIWVLAARCPSMHGVETSVIGRNGRRVQMGTIFEGWDTTDASGIPTHTVQRHFELFRAKLFVFCPPHAADAVGVTARAVLAAEWATQPGELV